MEQTDLSETGRRLGHDLYRFRHAIERWAEQSSLVEGWTVAEARRLPRAAPDRFVNKWLQLRVNAFRRGRIVDERVTPDFIRQIDVLVCPVTRQPLTHAALLPTDWSIDRLNNDGAYATSNLAVMSTRANEAKSDRSHGEVFALAQLDEPTDGLMPQEWLRLASLMLGPCFADNPRAAPLMPLAAPPASRTALPAGQVVQYVFTRGAGMLSGKHRLITRMRPACPTGKARLQLERFAQVIHDGLKQTPICWDVWLRPEVMQAFVAWRHALDVRTWATAGAIASHIVNGHRVDRTTLDAWHLDQRGYFH